MDTKIKINLSTIPKELKLILEIIKNNNLKEINITNMTTINWNLFLSLALHHRVYPLLYSKLKDMNDSKLPDYVMNVLYKNYKTNTFYLLHLCSEMETFNTALIDSNIRYLYLKGPFLSKELYGDFSLRPSSDIDILVPIEELDRVKKILLERGYIQEKIKSVLGDWKWRHHHIEYYNDQKKIKIEVHWRLNPGPGREPTFNEMWGRKRSSKITSNSVYFLGNEDLLFFLICHGARHGWSRLRWLVDIDRLMQKELDWGVLSKQLNRYNISHIAGQSLILSAVLLNTNIQSGVERLKIGNRSKKLAEQAIFYLENMVNLHSPPVPWSIAKYHKNHLFSLMSPKQKFLYILSWLYPYPTDLETLPLPKQFHILYFILRPFLWAWRKTKHALP